MDEVRQLAPAKQYDLAVSASASGVGDYGCKLHSTPAAFKSAGNPYKRRGTPGIIASMLLDPRFLLQRHRPLGLAPPSAAA